MSHEQSDKNGEALRQVQRLHATTDAAVWAHEFNVVFAQLHEGCELDEGWLIGWFANAIEVGRDAGKSANPSHARPPTRPAFPTHQEIIEATQLYRAEIDKRMDTKHPSASPSIESMTVVLRDLWLKIMARTLDVPLVVSTGGEPAVNDRERAALAGAQKAVEQIAATNAALRSSTLEPTAWRCSDLRIGCIEITSDAHLAGVRILLPKLWSVEPLYAAPSATLTPTQERMDAWNGALEEAINAGQDCFDAGGGWSEAKDAIRTLRSTDGTNDGR